MSRMQMPQELPLFYDRSTDTSARPTTGASNGGFEGWPHMTMYKYGWDSGNIRSTKDSEAGPAVNHPGNINAVFADGHAESKGLWMYKDTLSNPNPDPHYYWRYFHPQRAAKPKTVVGDAWPCGDPKNSCFVPGPIVGQ